MDSIDKVLIVDDCEAFPFILCKYLLDDKLKIIVRKSAQEGIEYIKDEGPVSVVISDYQMPGMDGIEFFAWIKIHSPHSYRVLSSIYSSDFMYSRDTLLEFFHHYFLKPGEYQEVRNLVSHGREHYKKSATSY